MERTLLILSLFAILGSSLACEKVSVDIYEIAPEKGLKDSNDRYPEIARWFDYLCSPELGGRYSGSEGIKKAVIFISDIIGTSDSLRIETFNTNKCEMRNIIFHIQGECDSLVVLGAHYDAYGYYNNTPLPGADDNLSGTTVLLSVIKGIQKNRILPNYSVEIFFFDGEEIGRYGSYHYVAKCENGIKRYINFDTCGRKNCGAGAYFDATHSELKEESIQLISLINDVKLKVAEYNPKGYTTDCEPFLGRHIPCISIMNDTPSNYLHSSGDTISNISFSKIYNIAKGTEEYLRTI